MGFWIGVALRSVCIATFFSKGRRTSGAFQISISRPPSNTSCWRVARNCTGTPPNRALVREAERATRVGLNLLPNVVAYLLGNSILREPRLFTWLAFSGEAI